ncbi:MAG TPA: terminase [Acidobacteriaceae bacterium]|nr:terminase [Acidobacteriaceae bacterium]
MRRESGDRDWLEHLLKKGKPLHEAENTEEARERLRELAEELLKIRNRNGEHVALVPNRAQLEFERNREKKNIVLKARQMGISTWVSARFFLKTITRKGTLTVQVAHTREAAESLFRMVHRFLEQMPEEYQDVLRTSKSSARQIIFPKLDSEYRVVSAGNLGAGRGLTINNLHCSEVARWPGDAAETLQGLRAAMPPTGELVLESTPMGAGGCFWREWQDARETGMAQHFFPWWYEDTYVGLAVDEETLTEDERRLKRAHGLTHAQIGYRRNLIANFRGLAKQEYAEDPTECFLASGECAFERDVIARRLAEIGKPAEERKGGKLQIWLRPEPGRTYLVAVDPAGGGSEGDYSVAQVIDVESAMQCAELQCRADPHDLAVEVEKLAREYNGAELVVERNNHGAAVLAHLASAKYPHIYEQGEQQGWLTSTLTRPRMIGGLDAALVEAPEKFRSERLLRECRTFVRQRNGKMAAQSGEHDDCVMAMAIALQVRAELVSNPKKRAVAA